MKKNCLDRYKVYGLQDEIINNLHKKEIFTFFPVQQEVVPVLLRQNSSASIFPQDICVSSPTGSGKTLSYALPIVSCLLRESAKRLRALVILPSRELALQVYQVFLDISVDSHIRVQLTTGASSLAEEQIRLVGSSSTKINVKKRAISSVYGRSLVDILVTTPGRLLDHLQFTEGFTLQHLRFLVLDEADRLLANAYHGWVRTLISSTDNTRSNHYNLHGTTIAKRNRSEGILSHSSISLKLPLQRLLFSATLTDDPSALALLGIHSPLFIHCKGLNATTTNILGGKISQSTILDSEVPDAVLEERFELPQGLKERKLLVSTQNRLSKLISVLVGAFHGDEQAASAKSSRDGIVRLADYIGSCKSPGSVCIIFVSSVDASHRLSLLLKLINQQINENSLSKELEKMCSATNTSLNQGERIFKGKVGEMSRLIRASEREEIIAEAGNGDLSIIVSSDRMARGMDLSNLKLVINYDAPKLAKSYVHRAGRTARAGREGMCLTLLKLGQIGSFNRMRKSIGTVDSASLSVFKSADEIQSESIDSTSVIDCFMPQFWEQGIQPIYEAAIASLPALLQE